MRLGVGRRRGGAWERRQVTGEPGPRQLPLSPAGEAKCEHLKLRRIGGKDQLSGIGIWGVGAPGTFPSSVGKTPCNGEANALRKTKQCGSRVDLQHSGRLPVSVRFETGGEFAASGGALVLFLVRPVVGVGVR